MNRWREQPSSPLARFIVVFLLSLAGLAILIYLTAIERGLEAQIDNLGLNRAVITQQFRASDFAGGIPEIDPQYYQPLERYGDVLPVKMAFGRVTSNYGPQFLFGEYDESALAALSTLAPQSVDGVIFFSSTMPTGAPIEIDFFGMRVPGFVSPMPGLLAPSGESNIVLLPKGLTEIAFRSGFVHTVFFEKRDDSIPIGSIVAQLEALNSAQYPAGSFPPGPSVASAAKFAAELDEFRTKQAFFTALLVGGVGGVIALIFGATAILEFRQSEFVCALLRSFGVGDSAILLQRIGEGLVIANVSLWIALAAVPIFQSQVSGDIAFFLSGFEWGATTPLFLCVNLGAILAACPLVFGLRKPIGEVLS